MVILLFLIIICLALGIGFVFSYLRIVCVRQALIIYDRVSGNVHRLIIGPRKVVLVWPLEKTLSLDLTMQATNLNMNDVLTSDLAIATTLDIFYAFDPPLLQAADLNPVLPVLTEVERIVQSWANYILRSLAIEFTTSGLLTAPVLRARLEGRLHRTLQDRVQPLGVRICTIRLLCQPAPFILEAQLAATRTKLAAQAQAQALEMLTAALGPAGNVMQILPLYSYGLIPAGFRHIINSN